MQHRLGWMDYLESISLGWHQHTEDGNLFSTERDFRYLSRPLHSLYTKKLIMKLFIFWEKTCNFLWNRSLKIILIKSIVVTSYTFDLYNLLLFQIKYFLDTLINLILTFRNHKITFPILGRRPLSMIHICHLMQMNMFFNCPKCTSLW